MRISGTQIIRVTLCVALIVAVGLFIWPAATHAIEVWSTDEEFTFGFVIPPLSAGVVWLRRRALARAIGPGAHGGLAIVLAGIALSVIGGRMGLHAIAGLAVIPLLWGVAAYLQGWKAARVLAFPIAFLAFGFGLYRGLLDSVGFTLQEITAMGAATIGRAVGLPVVRDGLILHSQQFAFVVAEQCSGMSSLLSLLALGALWVSSARGPIPARLAVMLGILPLVVIANTTRVTLVLLVATWFGQDAALGFFHGASSLVLFALALLGLLVLSRLLGCEAPTFAF